uniref:Deoxyribonuclease-2-alpha-like n=1 Tax=Dermatophagoides pteronyssinus TaxID=6956 RepID=A0A6P6YJ08_DERPT|nr:deoxyribonuclease-2-alpha-like [Dermatophagoides pteronyssinus]
MININLIIAVVVVVGLLNILQVSSSTKSPQCIDDSGQPVDWYIIYKFPYLKHLNEPDLFGGYHYAYQTSKTIQQSTKNDDGWHFSSKQITESESIFGQTFKPFFSSENRPKLTSMFYNDQPPNGTDISSSYAHSKGMILTDSKQGFWLIHTIPKFMQIDEKYSYPATGGRYGQVALCISLSTAELTKIVEENFLLSRPYVYHMHIDSITEQTDLGKALIKLEHHKWSNGSKNFTELTFKSLNGQLFQSFYKSPSYHVDLYSDIVAKSLKKSLRVETWRHNPGNPLHSECQHKQAEVENIKEIQLKFIDSKLEGNFSYYDDHSKWAITRSKPHHQQKDQQSDEDEEDPFISCIGDINRVESQFHRGGGTTCLSNSNVWSNFNSFIQSIERCPDDPGTTSKPTTSTKHSSIWQSIWEKIRNLFH